MWKDTLRASLRNLYVNLVLSAVLIGFCFTQSLLDFTQPTELISTIIRCVLIALLIGWGLMLCHWIGETCLELRKNNYYFLLSLLPFILPPLVYLLRNNILSLLPELQ